MSHPLKRRIATLRSRVWWLATLYGLSWVVGAVLLAALVLGFLDYLVRFQDPGIRVICWLVMWGVLAWTCYRYLLLALTAPLPDVELARRLQRRFPVLGDSLASAVDFLDQSEDDPTAGSVALRRAVIAQTTAETEPLDFSQALERGPTLRAVAVSLAICLVAMTLVYSGPENSWIAIQRLTNPFRNVPWPQKHHLALWEEVTRVARGQVFEVEVMDERGARLPSDVRIHYRFENADGSVVEESELMRFVDGAIAARKSNGSVDPRRQMGVMVARRENVSRPFSYRVEGGDDRSMLWIPVEVLEPPRVESVSATLIPPEYTGWLPEEADKQIHALEGTRVEMSATSTKPLQSACLCLDGGREIEARLSGPDRRALRVDFVVEKSGAYWFRLTDVEGLEGGGDARWEIRAVPDAPPSVSIQQPTADVFVIPQAEVPLRISAKDDLAVRRIEVQFTRSDRPDQLRSLPPLYAGPERVEPQAGGFSGDAELGHSLVKSHRWQLAELGLEPGIQVTFHATAADYRPSSGQSELRRLIVITPEDLTERIAAWQAAILVELSRVLEMQQRSRRQVGELDLRLGEVGRLNQLDLDHLGGAELGQQQVRRALTSRDEGVPGQILGLLADLENNKVDSPDIYRRMEALLEALDRLDREHLPIIERELASAIKAVQVDLQDQAPGEPPDHPPDDAPPDPGQGDRRPTRADPIIADSLAGAGQHQDQVIAALEQMLEGLGRWDQYRRFHSRISRLLRDQEQLAENTRKLAQQTLTKDLKDLLPQESADVKILAGRQFDLARQLDKIQQEMQQAAVELRDGNPLFAETVSDALSRARELGISGGMRSAGGSVQENQMGRAMQRQEQVIEDLKEVLDILANRREHELARLVKQLRDAEADLAEMAGRQEGLQKQFEEAGSLPDPEERRRRLERLRREQEQLQQEAERLARRLERLMAESAGRMTAQAAEKMRQAEQSAQQGDSQAASKRAAAAKEDLDQARQQLADRRRQAELELALEQMARLEQTLEAMHRQQGAILEQTRRLDRFVEDQGQLTRAQAASLHSVARDQTALQAETVGLTERLVGAEVLNLALSDAAGHMAQAAALLDGRQTGKPTQQAEQNALGRLSQLREALRPETSEEGPDGSGEGSGGPGGTPGQPGSGVQALVELKLLKLMQEEINGRTQAMEETFGSAEALTGDQRRQYVQLSREQGRLADLLLNLIQPQEDPEGAPDLLPGGTSRENEDERLLLPDEEGLR
jgi:hypothetical protein